MRGFAVGFCRVLLILVGVFRYVVYGIVYYGVRIKIERKEDIFCCCCLWNLIFWFLKFLVLESCRLLFFIYFFKRMWGGDVIIFFVSVLFDFLKN